MVVAAIGIAAAWVLVDHPLEGPVVLALSHDRGVHLTDVLAVVPLLWAKRVAVRD
jgi:hypothetical protein